jgi:hypothetical protein
MYKASDEHNFFFFFYKHRVPLFFFKTFYLIQSFFLSGEPLVY